MKICFVALELLGPFSGGGIATALAGQAEHHARLHDVTILYVNPDLTADEAPAWEAHFRDKGIRFVRAEFETFYPLDTIPKRSFAVKEYLAGWDEDFDLLIFHDYLGLGYYTALARKLGLAFASSKILSVVHGPSEWARSLNLVMDSADDVPVYELERKQVEMSDFVAAPSQHILDWCADQGWALPEASRPVSNLLPKRVSSHSGLSPGDVASGIDEVAFFGRLEIRKGFFEFLDAIKYLHKNGLKIPAKVTFLGAFCTVSDRNAAAIVLDYAQSWECEVQFLNNYDHEAAISYLVNRKPLTIIPSHDESFGLTAYECLTFGVPVLIADRGALSTLPEDKTILVEPSAHLIARRIDAALTDGLAISGIAAEHLAAEEAWDELLAVIEAAPTKPAADAALATIGGPLAAKAVSAGTKLVSVIMVHHNRPATFGAALDSVLAQSHEKIEVIVVDDGSRPADFARLQQLIADTGDARVNLIRQDNSYLGAARNRGAKEAKGDYLLFMDDDNVASPSEVETFLTIARATGADVLTAVSRMFRSSDTERTGFDIYCPVGPSLSLTVFGNPFGDANALVRRKAFTALGGYSERYAVGCEDYEFFTRAFVSGLKMQLVPEILFDYRSDEDGMMKELNTGKYLVNQLRGTKALFDSSPAISLAAMRQVMRVGQAAGLTREYSYWGKESAAKRRFPEIEAELANLRYRANAPQAVALVVKLLAGYGRIREAIALMERNGLEADDAMLAQLQRLLTIAERRSANAGEQSNILVNGAFEFWDLGRRFDGVRAYAYTANEWLLPSSKDRDKLVVSIERDNALFTQTHARQASFMRLQTIEADPEGYLFLTQRTGDLGRVLGNIIRVSALARASFDGALTTFLRVTEEHGTERFRDIWPDRQGWVTDDWTRSDWTFDLTDFSLDQTTPGMFASLFFRVPTDEKMTLDLADIVMVPDGDGATLARYARDAERHRASERCFRAGAGALLSPTSGEVVAVQADPGIANRLTEASRFHVPARFTVDMGRKGYLEVGCEECWRPDGANEVRLRLDQALPGPATALEDFLLITNYIEG